MRPVRRFIVESFVILGCLLFSVPAPIISVGSLLDSPTILVVGAYVINAAWTR
jgi:hypothetical protein